MDTIESELRMGNPGLDDEVYRDQARRYMGVVLGFKMREIIRSIFGDVLNVMISVARNGNKKISRELVASSTRQDAIQRIFRENRKTLVGKYKLLDDALAMNEVQALMKNAGAAVMLVQKSELAAAKRELQTVMGRPRLEPWIRNKIQNIKKTSKPLQIIMRGGPRTVSEYEVFLAHFM